MEASGAIFLPAARYRLGTTVTSQSKTKGGMYWTSKGTSDSARAFFLTGGVGDAGGKKRATGCSVRLVRPID